MIQARTFRIRGKTLLMHNGSMADPLNYWKKEKKKVTEKRSKTDADDLEIDRLSWCGSLYLLDGKPCLPARVIQAALVAGARTLRLGKTLNAAVVVLEDVVLHFDNEEIWVDLRVAWESGKFSFRSMVRIGQSRVASVRPYFENWSAEFALEFDDSLLDEAQIREIVSLAGRGGVGDYRPVFGRFVVE